MIVIVSTGNCNHGSQRSDPTNGELHSPRSAREGERDPCQGESRCAYCCAAFGVAGELTLVCCVIHAHIQTEHDFNLEKQTLVHEAKLAIQEEFTKKEKDREVQERITRSAEIGECRVKKMKHRDDLLQGLLQEAGAKCAIVARGQNYPQLLQKLIVQGLIKIEENDVEVFCRAEDLATVEKILPDAVKEYVDILKRESGVTLHPNVTVSSEPTRFLSEKTYGGVLLTALNGKIVCDNTMASRLHLVYEELLPSIRAILFPEP